MPRKSLYRLTREEREIFEEAKNGNIDVFTNYYLKGPTTGTLWTPGRRREPFKEGYDRLLRIWREAQKPSSFVTQGQNYNVLLKHEFSDEFPNLPAFHYNHGLMLFPTAREIAKANQRVQLVLGGYGSGKSQNLTQIYLTWLAIYDEFHAIVLGPQRKQAAVIYQKAMNAISGTLYEERFLVGNPRSPNEAIQVANDYVTSTISMPNTMTCYPLVDPTTFKNMEFDAALIEQSEMFFDFDSIIEFLGSRMRGRTTRTGRARLGVMHFIANSEFNPAMWDLVDRAEVEPKRYRVFVFSSYDNPYLTDDDLDNMEQDVGGTEEAIEVKMRGGRPLGDGKKFTRVMLKTMSSPQLDEELDAGIAANLSGYLRKKEVGIGTYEWGLPYKDDHVYCVIADPGSENPPQRNAYGIMVWDITQFPGPREMRQPATIAHMVWGYGNNDTSRWASHYADLVRYYRCEYANAFDATGLQTGYDQWMVALEDLFPEKINMGGNAKFDAINSGTMLASLGLFRVPASFYGFFDQMSHYDYPEPDKLRQDLVMTFIMSAWWLRRTFSDQLKPSNRIGDDLDLRAQTTRIHRQGRTAGTFSRVRR